MCLPADTHMLKGCGDIDNRTTTLFHNRREHCFGDIEGALQNDVRHGLEGIVRQVFNPCRKIASGVIDQNIQSTPVLDGSRHGTFDGLNIANIHLKNKALYTVAGQLGSSGFQYLKFTATDSDSRAVQAQLPGNYITNTGATPGNQGHLAGH